ncbi:MAG: hypothetical protein QHH14_11330 [Clostridiales bacterium]|jgi:hypothetical protein|nr:hypothetical protein [Clostridiales bacterium]
MVENKVLGDIRCDHCEYRDMCEYIEYISFKDECPLPKFQAGWIPTGYDDPDRPKWMGIREWLELLGYKEL